jgi:hypothetical protein
MSGHTKWEDLREFLGNKLPDVAISELKPGKYWKTWTRKYKKEDPSRWKFHKKQRVKYGYSEFDWWNFDSYIAGVIAHACERFANESHGYPGDMTAQQWKELCLSISTPLALWASRDRWKLSAKDEYEVLYPQVVEAMHKFADHFGSFWD